MSADPSSRPEPADTELVEKEITQPSPYDDHGQDQDTDDEAEQ